MICIRLRLFAVTLAVAAVSAPCAAQYAWMNDNGVRQYSDQPPPATVPSSRILKQPRGMPEPDVDATAPPQESTPSAAAKPMTLAEQNAAFLKRRAEQAEKDKKAAELARISKENAMNCSRARGYREALKSGQRIGTTDKNGERSYLTDQQREQELHNVATVLAKCK